MSIETIIALASGGTILGYILKGGFDRIMGRDTQSAATKKTNAKTEAEMNDHYRGIAIKADAARLEMQKELVEVRRTVGALTERNAQLEEKVKYLDKKVERLCKKRGVQ